MSRHLRWKLVAQQERWHGQQYDQVVATTEQGATLKTQKHENRGYQIGGTQCSGSWYGLGA